jgi:hypothetical protein
MDMKGHGSEDVCGRVQRALRRMTRQDTLPKGYKVLTISALFKWRRDMGVQ